MGNNDLEIINWLLASKRSFEPKTHADFSSFRQAFSNEAGRWEASIDRAIAGGFIADCVAYAFAAGYNAALQRLVGTLPVNATASFCITEEGGGHPRAIRTRIVPSGVDAKRGRIYGVSGRKKYITCAKEADLFLVAASEGVADDGKNRIRMVRIDAQTPGISIVPMKGLNMVPEISHGEIGFSDVVVSEADLLPGDGYTAYIKPFRTIEDLHVSAAILGYVFRNACIYDWGRDILESILGRIVLLRSLAFSRTHSPAALIVLGDALNQVKMLFMRLEPFWEKADKAAKAAWDRDKALMQIADKARDRRLQTAWETLFAD